MRKIKLLALLAALVCAGSMSADEFLADVDFAIDFRTNTYTVVSGTVPTCVEVTGDFHDTDHGYRLPVITIPVTAGNYKVTMGTCKYSNQDGFVKTGDDSYTYATLETNNGTCYDQAPATNVVGAIFNVPSDQIIKVYGAEYTPYIAIKKMAEVPAITSFVMNLMDLSSDFDGSTLPTGVSFTGTNGSDKHGYRNLVVTVPAKAGNYRLTLGGCQYASETSGAGNVKSETNAILASFNQKTADCYHNGAQYSVSMIFAVDIDQTITITCGQYTPYLALEVLAADKFYIDFVNETAGVEGAVPAETTVTKESALTLPANRTMYKDGYTLTGWTDGINTYAPGETFTPTSNMVLTSVFTANATAITDATEEVTVRWNFGESNGAPTMHLEGNSGFLIAQATIAGNPVDVRLDIDATAGKFFNKDRGDQWAQVKANTTFTFPAKDGATAEVGAYATPTDYSLSGNVLTVNDISNYYSYLEVVYPASVPTFINITAKEDPGTGIYYATFYYGSAKYALPNDGTEAYAAEVSGDAMRLHKIAEGSDVLPAGTAVIFKAPSSSISLTLTDAAAVPVTKTNHLHGVDVDTEIASVVSGACYVLSGGSNGVGFYLYESPNVLKAHKAYIDLDGGAAQAPKHLRFVYDAAQGVENVQGDNVQSTKVVENGVLYIIKSGVKYNAQGQTVK